MSISPASLNGAGKAGAMPDSPECFAAVEVMTPSRGNRHCWCAPPARRNGETMFTENPDLDVEAQSFQDRGDLSIGRAFRRIDSYDQDSGRSEKMHEPIQRGLKGADGTPLPTNQSNVVLAARGDARRNRRNTDIQALRSNKWRPC
jgi:hypothetical protein